MTIKPTQRKKTSVKADIEPLAVGRRLRETLLLAKRRTGKKEELVLFRSKDGVAFGQRATIVHLLPAKGTAEEKISACRNFRLGCFGAETVLTYVFDGVAGSELKYAGTKDLRDWRVAGSISDLTRPGVLVPASVTGTDDLIYVGGERLMVASSADLNHWKTGTALVPTEHFFNDKPFEVTAVFPTDRGLVVLYDSLFTVDLVTDVNLRDEKIGEESYLKVGAALFAPDKPAVPLWQSDAPLMEFLPAPETGLKIIGAAYEPGGSIRLYVTDADRRVSFLELSADRLFDQLDRRGVLLAKHDKNPIFGPTDRDWEAHGAFNPTAVDLGGKVHLLYRAVGRDGFSYIGYAASTDAVSIDERLSSPCYSPRAHFEGGPGSVPGTDAGIFASGGSWGGCEDPKVTQIEDQIYLTYVAHNGTWPMRTALTSISATDFLAKRWDKWTAPAIMSPPGVGSKSVVILPEKINNEYIVFHRVWPNIIVDRVSSLEFGAGARFLGRKHLIPPRPSFWDSQKLSVGAAPIKTDQGWLTIYNAVDRRDSSRYKIGAMLLDSDRPWEVKARSRYPILSPDEWYENAGKPGIAYPGGAIVRDGQMFVYYGGADRVSCVATIPVDEMLWHLERDRGEPLRLEPVSF